jgi:HSP20 family protein
MLEKLEKWNPLKQLSGKRGNIMSELHHLQRDINRMFDGFFGERQTAIENRLWSPAVDVSETDSEVLVRVDLPGMTQKDVEVHLRDNVLTLQGEKKQHRKKKKERYYFEERYYGSFNQSFTLPAKVDPERIQATFKHGVLSVTLPKIEGAKPKKIAISTS